MESCQILGVRIDQISKKAIRDILIQKLQQGTFCHIATVNPEFLVETSRNPKFKTILNQTSLNICDGAGISILGRFFYGKKIERITGVELAEIICEVAEKLGKSVFLLGGWGVGKLVEQKICSMFPKLKIVGTLDGDVNTFEEVQNANPDIVLVAFGAPKQEYWIAEKGSQISSLRIGIGVGGTFDFWAGKALRAPEILRKLGLEWLWRLILQPRRWRRIVNAVIVFPWLVVREKVKKH
ncbi:WecB/TagA/CpsF family glycosyltransferase [Candidatus Gracilibacteria bacterium]|nr:WecB/TagA/CpsF family glycosyltransferase [Candidatus Gracilibacteria bacterium]